MFALTSDYDILVHQDLLIKNYQTIQTLCLLHTLYTDFGGQNEYVSMPSLHILSYSNVKTDTSTASFGSVLKVQEMFDSTQCQ